MWFAKTYIPKGFNPSNWNDNIQRFKHIYELKEISKSQWVDIYNILIQIVEGRLGAKKNLGLYADSKIQHGKMISGIHSEEELGTPAPDYYTEEAIIRTRAGIRTWDRSARTLIEHLEQVTNKLISDEGELAKKRKQTIEKAQKAKAEETFKDEEVSDYIVDETTSKPVEQPTEGLDKSVKEEALTKFTIDETTAYILDLFKGDDQATKYVKLRLERYERNEIIEEFDGDTKLVDALAARFKYTVNKPEIAKDIFSNFDALVTKMDEGYKRLLHGILDLTEDHKEEFVRDLNPWIDSIDDYLQNDYKPKSHIWRVVNSEKILTNDDLYAVKMGYDNEEKIFILIIKEKDLVGLQIHTIEEAPNLFEYKDGSRVYDDVEKWLFDELDSFKADPFQ